MQQEQPDLRDGIASLPTDQLEDRIGELAAHINAATCQWLLLIAEFDHREAWKDWGCKSCADWLSLRCGLGMVAGREHVRVARSLDAMPLVRQAFAEGRLSYSKVRAITRVAHDTDEAQLLEMAVHATAAQLERLVRKYRWVITTQFRGPSQTHADRFLHWSWDDDGSVVFYGRLPAEDGALLLSSLEAARDRLHASAEAADDVKGAVAVPGEASEETPAPPADVSAEASLPEPLEPPRTTNADALVLVAETALAAGSAHLSAAERYQVVVHVDAADLQGEEGGGRCELENGPPIAAETARRLACDASVIAMTLRDGRPLTVGRKTRSIPPSLRRALRARDGCCQFPGCSERRFVDAHHIHHWAHGGETKLSNLLLLCRRHHRLLHEGGFKVENNGVAMRFRRPDGRLIPASPERRRGDCNEVRRITASVGAQIGPETAWAVSRGEGFSYVNAVEGLLVGAGLLEFGPVADRASAETSGLRELSSQGRRRRRRPATP